VDKEHKPRFLGTSGIFGVLGKGPVFFSWNSISST
jgi:hypothetical protein